MPEEPETSRREVEAPEKASFAAWSSVLGIILRAAYAVGVLVYVAFYTGNFTFFQKLVVLLVAFIIYGTVKSIIHIVRPGRRRIKYSWW